MAKKKSKTKSKYDFGDLLKSVQEIVPETEIMSSEAFEINNYVPMGNYLLNAQISGSIFGGLPEGRMLVFAGEKGTGKTFLSLNACREAQQKYGSKIVWLDTEAAMDKKTMERMGIETDGVLMPPVDDIRKAAQIILKVLDESDPNKPCDFFIVLDSIANMSSAKEIKDMTEGNNKVDMTKQKELKGLFRTLLNKLRNKKVPMIATSHVYDSIGSFIPQKNISGGQGAQYGASIILMLYKANLKADKDIHAKGKAASDIKKTGIVIRSVQEKARFTKAGVDIKIHVSFYKGMNPYVGLRKYLDWEHCGVAPGKYVKGKDGKMVFEPSKATKKKPSTYAVRSLEKHFTRNEFWKYAEEIFTDEVLEYVDTQVRPVFEFPEYQSEDELEEIDATLTEEDDE